MLELASSWLAARQRVASVIARVEQIVKAIGWTLNVEDLAAIDKITKG